MGLSLLTAEPIEPAVTLAEAKAQCRVDGNDDDALIERLIGMASEQAEALTGRVFIRRQYRLTLDAFPADSLDIPCPPLASVQEVSYLDQDGVRQVLAAENYQAVTDEIVGRLLPAWGKSWPSCRRAPGSVRVDFTAGYGDAATAVPESVRSWILLAIGTLYAQREAIITGTIVSEVPRGFWDGLLDRHRVWRAL